MALDLQHAGIAFFMVLVAGLATCLGASAVFFRACVKLASKRVLAASLGFSAGIMLYVSFIEIFQKAKTGFEDAGLEEKYAYMLSTASVFAGMLLMRLLIAVTHFLDPDHEREFEKLESVTQGPPEAQGIDNPGAVDVEDVETSADAAGVAVEVTGKKTDDVSRKKQLWRMGLNTAMAITIHNFPEGLAGMVAGLSDPTVGFTLTFAIAVHNIPEGLCIALPIYYSTGSRLKGFMMAAISGLAEPVGALIAWGIVASSAQDMYGMIYGILFGLVAGIMIILVLMELLPNAHRYDPQDAVVTNSVVIGMVVMASSLILFML